MKISKRNAFRSSVCCAVALACTLTITVASDSARSVQAKSSVASTDGVQVYGATLGALPAPTLAIWKSRWFQEIEIGIEQIVEWLDPAKGSQITEQPDPVDVKTPEDATDDRSQAADGAGSK